MRIISDNDAILQIGSSPDRYLSWIGAGASAEAGVQTAASICDEVRQVLTEAQQKAKMPPAEIESWIVKKLRWNDLSRRYLSCIQAREPNPAKRVDFFRKILREKQPSFLHHALALLMTRGLLKRTCLTTNFDHLLENAFAQQGVADCQSLRSDSEKDYWEDREGRHFVAKLHGDIDTNNILNTAAEIMVISKANADFFNNVTADSGLVVLGASGNEQSVRDLFRQAVSKEAQQRKVLSFGLLWGVYMGNDKPERLSPEELQTLVQKRVETEVHPDIAEIIEYSSNELFCFFPVWGAGAFMRDLIEYFRSDRDLFATAARYLDHELRLQRVFSEAGYPNDAVEKHLRSLREQRKRIDSAPPLRRLEPETVVNAQKKSGPLHVRVVYGDITSRGLLGDGDFPQLRRGVVSPEDTFVSAGGGVAYGLLAKAGPSLILNELAKFTPVEQASVVVTSGGNLPVHYILHAAALKIAKDATYLVTQDDVRNTVKAAVEKADVLKIGLLFVPLLGAGLAPLTPHQSLDGILQALRMHNTNSPLRVDIVVFREKELPRNEVRQLFEAVLGNDFVISD